MVSKVKKCSLCLEAKSPEYFPKKWGKPRSLCWKCYGKTCKSKSNASRIETRAREIYRSVVFPSRIK